MTTEDPQTVPKRHLTLRGNLQRCQNRINEALAILQADEGAANAMPDLEDAQGFLTEAIATLRERLERRPRPVQFGGAGQ